MKQLSALLVEFAAFKSDKLLVWIVTLSLTVVM
jgi:hypothetical protein